MDQPEDLAASPVPAESPRPGEEYVIKRDGRRVPIDYNKISRRLRRLKLDVEKALGHPLRVSIFKITKSTIRQIYNGITTSELDEEAAEVAAGMTDDPDYADFAGAILASNLEANNRDTLSFAEYAKKAYGFVEERTKEPCPLISKQLFDLAQKYGHLIDRRLVMQRNLTYGYFAFKTLAKGNYLLSEYRTVQKNKMQLRTMVPFETPQHALMRVALGLHGSDMDAAFELYDNLSEKKGTMATPTLFFAGTPRPQLNSCFLLAMKDDALPAIYDTLKDCALISKDAGGIGLHVHNIRATGSYIKGTNGSSNGLVPMLRVFNNTAKYVDQCFHPDTIVPTLSGPKRICDVTYNDRVVTSDGSPQKVIKVLHHPYEGKVFSVSTQHSMGPVMVTPAHPMLAIVEQAQGLNYNVIQHRLEQRTVVPEFVEVEKLNIGDMIGYPIPTFCEDSPAFSEADCRMLGIMIGEGHITQDGSQYGVTLHSTNQVATLDFVLQYLNDRFIPVGPELRGESQVQRITWTSQGRFPILPGMIYGEGDTKKVPSFALHLPLDKIQQILKGLLETGACINGGSGLGEILLETTSKNVIDSVRYMLLRLGVLSSGYTRDRVGETHDLSRGGSITCQKVSYVLRIPQAKVITDLLGIEEGAGVNYFSWDGTLYSRITEITESQHQGEMIDFEIENHHNYLTQLGLGHNGGGKRAGSFAIYLEPWHADVLEFLDLKRPHGAEDQRARDLFYALWVPDLFFKRIQQGMDTVWSLMDPKQCPGLSDTYGEEFEALYTQYERDGQFVKQIPIRQLVEAILTTQIETGTPYILAKDACNRKSNQKNLGTIKSSNLCVTGETKILTREYGPVEIDTVVNRDVHVWNGQNWSQAMVRQTSRSADILRVEFSNGEHLNCTPYHKFFVGEPDPSTGLGRTVAASDLKQGDHITPFVLPGLEGVRNPCDKIYVHSVTPGKDQQPTYCFNEPSRHAGIFNGILTGNCTEIIEFSSPEESACCTLASLSLPAFVNLSTGQFDYQALYRASRVFIRALDRVVDINQYPIESARRSNLRHRPLGLGVQGLADVFCLLRLRFGSDASKVVNRRIAETMYFAALTESHALTQVVRGPLGEMTGPYPSIDENGGAPIRHGIFQFDLWKDDFRDTDKPDGWRPDPALGWDWEDLRTKVIRDGVRNSLLVAPMPTASTSIILGNVEAFEPYYGMIYVRSTKSGEFYQMCRPLVEELIKRGLWVETMHPTTGKTYIPLKDQIMAHGGSIQSIAEIPDDLKEVFVCITDLKLKDLTEMARDRGVFTDQSMSLNVHFRNKDDLMPDLLKYMLYAWKLGLKTISYYTRTIQKLAALNFTGNSVKEAKDCVACSS